MTTERQETINDPADGPEEIRTEGRAGPAPLTLHMGLQMLVWTLSRAGLPLLRSGSLPWRPNLKDAAAALRSDLEGVDLEAFGRAVDAEAIRRISGFASAVRKYHLHPARRDLEDPPVVWERGSARLLDYGSSGGEDTAMPLLVVPSLINRFYVMDLIRGRSLIRHLAGSGIRPFVLDWGSPAGRERTFSLSDYICRYLEDALAHVVATTVRPVAVMGYCMGGLLALALAERRPEAVSSLALLATPWDFHAGDQGSARLVKAMAPQFGLLLDLLGILPVNVLQAMFMSIDPYLAERKFRRFAALEAGSERARNFVALEDWLNDGVPLAAPVARELLFDWYGDNATARGAWKVADRPVRPAEVRAPTLVVIPEQDTIVPPESSAPLAGLVPRAERWSLAAGHIGMVAGGRAERTLYAPLAGWLKSTLH